MNIYDNAWTTLKVDFYWKGPYILKMILFRTSTETSSNHGRQSRRWSQEPLRPRMLWSRLAWSSRSRPAWWSPTARWRSRTQSGCDRTWQNNIVWLLQSATILPDEHQLAVLAVVLWSVDRVNVRVGAEASQSGMEVILTTVKEWVSVWFSSHDKQHNCYIDCWAFFTIAT